MKNKALFLIPFILLLSGCTTTLPEQMIGTIVLFYNILLGFGYLLIFSTVFGRESREMRLVFGILWVLAVYVTVFISNSFYDHSYFKIGLPYFWLIAR